MKQSLLIALFALGTTAWSQVPLLPSDLKTDLDFEKLFPRKSYMGRVAQSPKWSTDGRYVAYLWNPFGTLGGSDLYLYDTQTQRTSQLTNIKMFAEIDADTEKSIARYEKEKADEDKRLKLGDLEFRTEVQRLRTENEKRREPLPSYPGISEFEWANTSNELVFGFKGDLFRWKIGEPKWVRLTKTKDAEAGVEWTPNDSGITYRRGSVVYRTTFGSHMVEQLNPALPGGVNFGGYHMSPDGNRMLIFGNKPGAEPRQVDYITYRERFAQARKTGRGVADDDFTGETLIYVFDIADDAKGDGKPTEVWKWAGGEEFQETSFSDEPWSSDSTKLTFASWKRDKKELIVHVVDAVAKKVNDVYKTTSDGEHRSPSLCAPQFMPGDKQIAMLLDSTGFRHVHLLDLVSGAVNPLTGGSFECYPIKVSKDGESVYVHASKEHPSRMDLYRVDVESRNMIRLTTETGFYDSPVFSPDAKRYVATFRNWNQLNDLVIGDGRGQAALTNSHDSEGFMKNIKLKPELFSYSNRVGQTIHGFMFLPPGFKKTDKRPLMIYVYGGPLGVGKSVNQGDFNSSAYLFNMYLTYVLGYVTVTIDPRGQSCYGNAFGKANWDKPGVAQVEDLSDGVKYLIDNFGVDPKRVAINGWSFGGFQTQMCLYTAPDVFTLGIAGAGPTQWQNYNTWYTGGVITNSPKGQPDPIDKYSLTHMAKNLRSPLLLLHGVEDTNVLFQDTIMVYRELLKYGKGSLVELAIDPTGGHGMGGDMNNRDRHAIYLAFLLKHWGLGGSR